jgi:ATP-dependent DNA helicase RecQ
MLDEATALVSGTQVSDGVREDEGRDRILAGFSHILVDEYQDIDQREYAFISAIAGRREVDEDRRLTIMAVGDDDQSIYQFKGANVEFIRRFQKDYGAQEHYLTENYRSTQAIIGAANTLISKNTDRMKVAHPIRINRTRMTEGSGGRWEQLDPVVRGKVQRVHVRDAVQQAEFIAGEIQRLSHLSTSPNYSDFAVLARTHEALMAIRAVLDECGIPVDWRAEDDVSLATFKIREVRRWLNLLEGAKHATWMAEDAKQELRKLRGQKESNRWWRLLDELWSEWAGETGEGEVPVSSIREFFVEAIIERQRAHRTAEGVVLVTAHKAKGLEFPHVFIADGGWEPRGAKANVEEERRVFYVAATRAKETLTVMTRKDQRNPFPAEMTCDSVIDRAPRTQPIAMDAEVALRRYATIPPTDLFISYAAQCPANSPVHAAIRATNVGDPVRLVPHWKSIHIQTNAGVPIGSLSAEGRKHWEPLLHCVRTARVSAMIQRTKEQEAEEYRDRAVVDAWEFPVIEVCWNPPDVRPPLPTRGSG